MELIPPLKAGTLCKISGRVHIFRGAGHLKGAIRECLADTLSDQGNGEVRDVDAYPFAPELLGRVDRRTATAERIDHHVARVAAGPNDAFKQGYGLLRGVAEIFRT